MRLRHHRKSEQWILVLLCVFCRLACARNRYVREEFEDLDLARNSCRRKVLWRCTISQRWSDFAVQLAAAAQAMDVRQDQQLQPAVQVQMSDKMGNVDADVADSHYHEGEQSLPLVGLRWDLQPARATAYIERKMSGLLLTWQMSMHLIFICKFVSRICQSHLINSL